MADQRVPDSGEQASGGPNRSDEGKRTPFSIAQARRELREAERVLKQYEDEKVKGQLLEDAKDAVREARKTLENLTTGSRADRREARSEFMGEYYNELGGPWIAELVKRDEELRRLFEKAIRTDDVEGFLDDIYQSKWWNDPKKSGSWKTAFQMEFAKDKTAWNDSITDAKDVIKKLADRLYDMVVPEAILDQIARRYLYQGWSKNENEGLRTWLASQFNQQAEAGGDKFKPGGLYTETYNTLRDAARAYGVDRDKGWLDKTTRDILNPKSGYSDDDAWNELISEAELMYPVFAGKLSKDRSVRDLGAGYINQLYRRLELGSPDEVDLTDPLLRKAFTTPNEKGEPALMPLWQFEQEIKKDARWQYTTNALSTYSQIGSDLARMMGFVG